jgi:ribonuclease BN (tRNA processing enzyme)
MLKIDFYESGDGETIILTFPNGGIGIVDAHPSPLATRPPILDLIHGRTVHFVCLTHPHRDHGADLIPVLEQHPDIKAFWHTVSDVDVTVFLQQEAMSYPAYPSACREAVERMKKGWADFLIDLYYAVAAKEIPRHQLRNDLREEVIDGVEIHFLGPDEQMAQQFVRAHNERLKDFKSDLPDPNLLSAILALKYGDVVVVLGADALKENWRSATQLFFKLKLPKATILKVPHHGAANALKVNPHRHEHSYLDICSHTPRAKSVLFAGDAKHPDPDVFRHLLGRTEVTCVSNGLKHGAVGANPLNISIPGARAATLPPVCNPVVSFTITDTGTVTQTAGSCGKNCGAMPAASA